jgi:hypothetical protein
MTERANASETRWRNYRLRFCLGFCAVKLEDEGDESAKLEQTRETLQMLPVLGLQ